MKTRLGASQFRTPIPLWYKMWVGATELGIGALIGYGLVIITKKYLLF